VFNYSFQTSKALTPSSVATIVLTGVAGLNFLIYLFAFVYPYNLFKLYSYPHLGVRRFAQDNPMVIWWLASVFVIQCGLYWLGWRSAQHAKGRIAWFIVLGGALAFSVVLLFMYPFDAADIFDYIMRGRILGVYGANPFQDVAEQFISDPFYPYVTWRRLPSPYGPVWEILAGGTARMSGDSIIANVLAFKLVSGIFTIASIALVALILRRTAPERALAGVTLLAWNPVVLSVTLGNGHNDITIVFCMLAAVWALIQQRYTLAILALVLGTLFKFIPLLLLPAACLIALRTLPNTRARVRFLGVTTLAVVAVIILTYGPFWYGLETLQGLNRQSLFFTASLPAFFYTWLWPTLGRDQAAFIVNLITTSLTVLFVLWQSWHTWRDPSWLRFCQVAVNIFLFYLLLTCSWFQQWYTIWPLGMATLLPSGPTVYLAMILGGYAVLSKQMIFGPLIFGAHPLPEKWREIWFGPTVLGLPWLYAFFSLTENFLQKLLGSEE
jgi:alpha-1,6-mannosyltransferase